MIKKTSGTIVSRARVWKKRLGFLLGATMVIAICLAIRHIGGGSEKAEATPPEQSRNQNYTARQANQYPARQTANSARQATHYPVKQATATLPGKASASVPISPRAALQASAGKSSNPSGTAQKTAAGSNGKKLAAPIVAEVNGRKITRDQLAQNCLQHYGDQVMETICNKYLISLECQKAGITITREEVNAEIERLASRFKLPVDQWFKLLKEERGITGQQYADEIIWPTLALRKLSRSQMKVTSEDIQKEYEIMYGKQIRARLIAMENRDEAEKVRAEAAAHASDAEYFGNLAMKHSVDTPSAAAKGIIQPILRHGTYQQIEQAAFSMKDGAVSPVIEVVKGKQYVILRKEGENPARNVKLDDVLARKLEEIVRDRKLRGVASNFFKNMQEHADIKNVWNDPKLHQQMPDVAARINGKSIPMPEFIQACLDRHGEEVLEGLIGRTLIELEAREKNVTVSPTELDAEVVRSASMELKPKPDGSPDVDSFKKMIVEEQRIAFDVYLQNAVWPSVALRKLAEPNVQITEKDMQKSYEANYGPRVRCLAIVLNNQRRANEVWAMARKNNTSDNFGELAAQYSIEPGSQALRGEIPPIKKNGGRPLIEEEAFKLKPGAISGIIQVDDKNFVILRCEGYTTPTQTNFAEVKKLIQEDLYEKLLRVQMSKYYEEIQSKATIDNYLTGRSIAPNRKMLGDREEADTASLQKVPNVYQQPRTR